VWAEPSSVVRYGKGWRDTVKKVVIPSTTCAWTQLDVRTTFLIKPVGSTRQKSDSSSTIAMVYLMLRLGWSSGICRPEL